MALLARGSFRGFGRRCSPGRHCCPRASSRGVHCSFNVLTRVVSAVLVRRSRYAVGPYPGFAVFRHALRQSTFQSTNHAVRRVPCSYRVLPNRLLAERLADTSPGRNRAAADKSAQRLSWTFLPYSTSRNRRSTFRTVSNPRCVPPAGFGYPLDGFLPPSPCRLSFTPTALVGLAPAERSPFERYRARFRADEPTYRFLPPLFSTKRRAGPTGRGSWALTLPKVPCGRRRLSPPTRRILPWGFSLPGQSSKDLDPHFGRSPLTRFPNRPPRPTEADHRRRPDASQRLNQPLPDPNRSKRQALSIGPNNPRRVPAPARS